MFGSFMPMFGGGRSKASSLSGRPDESQGGFSNFARGFGNAFGQTRGETNPGGQSMPPQAFGQERALGPAANFGQMIGGMFGGRMGQMGQPMQRQMPFNITPFNPNAPSPMLQTQGGPASDFMPGGRFGGPGPRPVPGDLSNMPGQIGDMYRQGKIQTFGGPRAMGPSFGMF